jgi:hypothetical protein
VGGEAPLARQAEAVLHQSRSHVRSQLGQVARRRGAERPTGGCVHSGTGARRARPARHQGSCVRYPRVRTHGRPVYPHRHHATRLRGTPSARRGCSRRKGAKAKRGSGTTRSECRHIVCRREAPTHPRHAVEEIGKPRAARRGRTHPDRHRRPLTRAAGLRFAKHPASAIGYLLSLSHAHRSRTVQSTFSPGQCRVARDSSCSLTIVQIAGVTSNVRSVLETMTPIIGAAMRFIDACPRAGPSKDRQQAKHR